jgi:hypothetical protein
VRFSVSSGIPIVADNDPNGLSPRAMAVRFHLADHVHTDIIAHSQNGFPVRTGEEFLDFFRAIAASGPRRGGPAVANAAGLARANNHSDLNGIFGHYSRRTLIWACELPGAGSAHSMVRTRRKRAFPAIIFA